MVGNAKIAKKFPRSESKGYIAMTRFRNMSSEELDQARLACEAKDMRFAEVCVAPVKI